MQTPATPHNPTLFRLLLAAALLLVATTTALTHAHVDQGDAECVACSLGGQPIPTAATNPVPAVAFAPGRVLAQVVQAWTPQRSLPLHPARAPPANP